MPTHLKKLVRSRMAKTGETYATALRYVRRRAAKRRPAAAPEPTPALRLQHRGAARRDPRIDAYARSIPGVLGGAIAWLVALVRSAVPAHDEVVIHGAPQFCVEGEPFCYLVGYSKHVTLGFCDGAALPDPAGLLEGKGKLMRHVKVRAAEDAPVAALLHIIRSAARRVRDRQAADRNS